MNYPAPLYKGDTVGLVAPCSPVTQKRLDECIKAVLSLGLHVLVGDSCTESLHGYLAGPAEIRAGDLNSMFDNPDVKGIFCIRGGYGSTEIMQLLDYKKIRKNPKVFVGYSDVTSFHLAFQSLCNMVTFHGPMVSSNMVDDFDPYTKQSFLEAISMPSCFIFKNPPNHSLHPIVEGDANGRVIGGCLSLISPAVGTFYQPDFRGKILFLEDVDESLPRCDKLMNHLLNSGVFNEIAGVLLGNFKDCINPYDPSYTMYDYFKDFFKDYTKPVVYGVQSGHDKPMGTIPLGTICRVHTKQNQIYFDYT